MILLRRIVLGRHRLLPAVVGRVLPLLLVAWAAGNADRAWARPQQGADCISCHTNRQPADMALSGYSLLDVPGVGLQPGYSVAPGDAAAILVDVAVAHDKYSLSVRGLSSQGVVRPAHQLVAAGDASWTDRGGYFTSPVVTTPQTWTFRVAVDAATPADYYPLEVQYGAKGRWGDVETLYLHVAPVPEPGSWVLALIAAAATGARVGRVRGRRRRDKK